MAGNGSGEQTPSARIDALIAGLGGWRGAMLGQVRAAIHAALPDVEETWKWRGVPVFEREGIICTGEVYKTTVKLTFARGASLDDPAGLFNASLDGNVRRAIDFRDDDALEVAAFSELVAAAAALNRARKRK